MLDLLFSTLVLSPLSCKLKSDFTLVKLRPRSPTTAPHRPRTITSSRAKATKNSSCKTFLMSLRRRLATTVVTIIASDPSLVGAPNPESPRRRSDEHQALSGSLFPAPGSDPVPTSLLADEFLRLTNSLAEQVPRLTKPCLAPLTTVPTECLVKPLCRAEA